MCSPHTDTTVAESREPRLEELGCGYPKTTCHPRQGQGEAPPCSPGSGGLQGPTHSSAPARDAPGSSGWCCQYRVPRWDPLGTWGSSAHPSTGLGDSTTAAPTAAGGQGDTSPGAGLTLEVAVVAQVAVHEAVVGLREQLPTKPPCPPIPGGPRGLHGCPRCGKTLPWCRQGRGNWDAVAERQGGTGRAQSGAGKRARGLWCSGQMRSQWGHKGRPSDRDTAHTPNCHRNSNRQRVPNCYSLLDNGQVKNCTSVKIKNKTKNNRPGRGSCAGGGFPALQPRSPVLGQRLEVGVPLCHAAVGTKQGVSAWWCKVTVPTTPGCPPGLEMYRGQKNVPSQQSGAGWVGTSSAAAASTPRCGAGPWSRGPPRWSWSSPPRPAPAGCSATSSPATASSSSPSYPAPETQRPAVRKREEMAPGMPTRPRAPAYLVLPPLPRLLLLRRRRRFGDGRRGRLWGRRGRRLLGGGGGSGRQGSSRRLRGGHADGRRALRVAHDGRCGGRRHTQVAGLQPQRGAGRHAEVRARLELALQALTRAQGRQRHW